MKAELKIVAYQLVLILIAASAAYGFYPEKLVAVKAVLFGGVISLLASIVMVCRLSQATARMLKGNQRGSLYIYLGVIERLLVAIALFSLGFLWLKLSPAYMVVGLVAGQIGFMIGGFRVKD